MSSKRPGETRVHQVTAAPTPNAAHRSPLTAQPAKPWYREPWPWLLMAAPLAAVAGGAVTLWLAVATTDGLVVDDYYKQGLAINQTMSREAAARRGKLRAQLALGDNLDRVRVSLSGEGLPQRLTLRIVHPTRAGMDQTAVARSLARGTYEAAVKPIPGGRWHVTLEDESGTWRLTGAWRLPEQPILELVANTE